MKSTNVIKSNNSINIDIDIKKLLDELENIGNEKEKEEFIKNYSRIKEEIKLVDEVLTNNDLTVIDEFESKTINELFKLLENNENKIFDNEILTIQELKNLIVITNILEKKINNDTMSIIDNK